MKVTLSPELQKRIDAQVKSGDALSANALVEEAVNFYLDFVEGELGDDELRETRTTIEEAIDEVKSRERLPAEDVLASLLAKRGK